MKIAIFGAGALGGYFGGRLLQAGYDVGFIARGAQLNALRQKGLTIESQTGGVHLATVRSTDDPAELGPVDVVLFLVKLYDTEAAARALAPLLGERTFVVSFQNGVDACPRIGRVIGAERVLGGVAYIFADVREPGVIRHSGVLARLLFGEFDGARSQRVQALQQILATAGIDGQGVEDITIRIWEKFVLLATLSGVTALTRLPVGAVLADSECAELARAALQEVAQVGFKQCPELDPAIADRQFTFAQNLPYGMRASMLDDLERGRRLELSHLSGEVVRLGRQLGIATPTHTTIYRALHPYKDGHKDNRI